MAALLFYQLALKTKHQHDVQEFYDSIEILGPSLI
jgi:hypothetical protein